MAGTFLPFLIHLFSSYQLSLQTRISNSAGYGVLAGFGERSKFGQRRPGLISVLNLSELSEEHAADTETLLECRGQAGSPLDHQAHLHGGSGDLLSVRCQY